MQSATRAKGTTVVPVPTSISEKHSKPFSATIIPYSNKQVARVADCSIDAAKLWRSGRRFPQWEYIKRLQAFPEVRQWVAEEFGFKVNGLIAELQLLANDSAPEAAQARAQLRSLFT